MTLQLPRTYTSHIVRHHQGEITRHFSAVMIIKAKNIFLLPSSLIHPKDFLLYSDNLSKYDPNVLKREREREMTLLS